MKKTSTPFPSLTSSGLSPGADGSFLFELFLLAEFRAKGWALSFGSAFLQAIGSMASTPIRLKKSAIQFDLIFMSSGASVASFQFQYFYDVIRSSWRHIVPKFTWVGKIRIIRGLKFFESFKSPGRSETFPSEGLRLTSSTQGFRSSSIKISKP